MIPLVDLKIQYNNLKPEIDKAISNVLESGRFIIGNNVKEFEKEIANYLNVKHAIAVASGSDALLLSLMAIGIKGSQEVITTPFTFFSTAGSISRLNAKPVFVDIDKDTFNINPEKIEEKITKKTKAIIPVHLYGQSCDMNPIMEIAEKHNLIVIEDACQALGAEYNNKKLGTIGHIGCFSFFPTKNLACYGDGGIIVTNDNKIAKKLRVLRIHGADPKYFHKKIGMNSRLDEIQAAVLRVKLKHLDNWIEKRRKNAQLYNQLLNINKPVEKKYNKHTYNNYTIKTRDRDKLKEFLKSKDIATEIYYPLPLHLQKCYKKLKYQEDSLPVAEEISKTCLSLPIYPELTEEQIKQIADAVNSFE